ncbi:MAG: hypothetical protein LBR79_05715 [Oscillospiraceae bacterium]|nr:hypothetical protein [Oscillospiraceae bacterium]
MIISFPPRTRGGRKNSNYFGTWPKIWCVAVAFEKSKLAPCISGYV